MKKLIVVLAVLLLVALPLISACGGDDGGLTEAEEHSDKGVEYRRQGRFDDAIAQFTKAIELDPNLAEAYFNRGNTYAILLDLQRAVEDYSEAIRLDAQNVLAYANRARAYTMLSRDQEAEQDFEKAVELGFDADSLRAGVQEIKAQR